MDQEPEYHRDLRAVGGSAPFVYWSVVVVSALVALWLLALATHLIPEPVPRHELSAPGSVAAAVGGVLWGVVTVTFYVNYLRRPRVDPDRVAVQDVDGGPALVLTWRTTFHRQPIFVAGVVAVLAVQLAVVLSLSDTPAWWAPLVVVGPGLLVAPAKIIELRRPVRVLLTPRGVGVTGFDAETWLDWSDVREIAVEHVNQWPVVVLAGKTAAASWRYERRPGPGALRAPLHPRVDVPGPALPVDARVFMAALSRYRDEPATRAEIGTPASRARLLEEHTAR
ncbi:hypothetical protein [Cellulomonas triticagri]|uniref:PH domain-containing protein n=1 Tax=Cellulomonas triticagri TaxID=2483352 RepID=A0A3M2JFB2_9CELL|nr:hypothetical protein [Cellulomonas triticagri]RMI12717.1 hypothetical protein EBM89_07620 [Cellulomonas triticagri]